MELGVNANRQDGALGRPTWLFSRGIALLALVLASALALGQSSPALALSKSEVFTRCAPATLLIVVATNQGLEIGSGIVIDSSGLAITNHHVVDQVAHARLFVAFLYDPKERIVEEDLEDYLRTHEARALRPKVVRIDATSDLALLKLPERTGGYPSVNWGDSDKIQIGQDVVAIGNPQGLAWTLTTGSISAIRKNAIQTETAINPGNSGGPLLDMDGHLVGINTWIRKNSQSLGFARPVNAVRAFAEDRASLGVAMQQGRAQAGVPAPTARPPSTSGNSPGLSARDSPHDLIIDRFAKAVDKKYSGSAGLRIICGLFSAFTWHGRTGLTEVGDINWLNDTMASVIGASDSEAERQRVTAEITDMFPQVAVSKDGRLWMRSGVKYFDVGRAVAWDVDDATGQIYVTDNLGKVSAYDPATGQWHPIAIEPAADVESSQGILYVLTLKGQLLAIQKPGTAYQQVASLADRAVRGQLVAAAGALYVLEPDKGALYRLRAMHWDLAGQPLATGVREIRAAGTTWYGLDHDGNVYSGALNRYIDKDGDLAAIWLIGEDLLALGKDNNLYHWSASGRSWHALSK